MSGSTCIQVDFESPSGRRAPEVQGTVRVLGAIVAGGSSRRFGGFKVTAEVGGLPMIEWSRRALVENVEDVVVVGGDTAVAAERGLGHLSDVIPGGGPLSGLVSALRAAADQGMDGVFALACDMPLVNPAVVRELLRQATGDEAVAPLRSGGAEPLCTFYPSGCLDVAQRCLAMDDRSLRSLLESLTVHLVDVTGVTEPADPEALLMSVNAPEDALRAEGLLSARSLTGGGTP